MIYRERISGFVTLVIILFLSGIALATPTLPSAPQVVALRATTPPIIDGKLDDEVWLEAALYGSNISGFVNHSGTALAKQETVAHVAYDENNLYIAVIAYKSDMDRLVSTARIRDSNVEKDDYIELSFDPSGETNSFYRIITNSFGTKADYIRMDSSWNPEWQIATKVLEDRWVCEISIPFIEMGLENAPEMAETWGFNISRNDISSEQRSSWMPGYGYYTKPEVFENLIFGASIQAPYEHNWEVQSQVSRQISSGVSHTSIIMNTDTLKETIQICAIDLDDPYTEVIAASVQNGVGQLETVRNIAQEHMDQNTQVVAAINGDFFSSQGIPSSLQIISGEIISSPKKTNAAVVIMDNGVELVEQIEMEASLSIGGNSLGVDAINRTRGSSPGNRLYVYTNRFGPSTRTDEDGYEVILKLDDQIKLNPGVPVVGKVQEIHEGGNAMIPPYGIVLSATGQKAKWLQKHIKPGDLVELSVTYNKGINRAKHVLGSRSYVLIKDSQLASEILDRETTFFRDRHPRTFAATKGNKLYLIVVDGRRSGYSDGLSLAEGAYYLKTLGMEQAINLDGGGSSTYLFRPLGEQKLELANRPSDNSERPVVNAFVITNTAPAGELHQLILEPRGTAFVLAGSTLRFDVKGVDRNLNPITVSRQDLDWKVEDAFGTVSKDGDIFVGGTRTSGILSVSLGEVEESIELRSVDTIADLSLHVEEVVLKSGSRVTITPKATAICGTEILISPDVLEWSIEGAIGTINDRGELVVEGKTGSGTVIARHGSKQASKTVYVIN